MILCHWNADKSIVFIHLGMHWLYALKMTKNLACEILSILFWIYGKFKKIYSDVQACPLPSPAAQRALSRNHSHHNISLIQRRSERSFAVCLPPRCRRSCYGVLSWLRFGRDANTVGTRNMGNKGWSNKGWFWGLVELWENLRDVGYYRLVKFLFLRDAGSIKSRPVPSQCSALPVTHPCINYL